MTVRGRSAGTGAEAGQILRWNLFIGGHLSSSVPVRLVDRTDEGQMLWLETGTPMWRTKLPRRAHLRDIAPEDRPAHGYAAKAGRWRMGSALIHQPAGAAHAVFWFFGRKQEFGGWYVNLEHRTHHGEDIDVTDHELDLTVAADRSWRWKDERSFAEKTGHPAYWSTPEAAAIRAEGSRVSRLAESGAFPSTAPGATSSHRPAGRHHREAPHPYAQCSAPRRRAAFPARALTTRRPEATGAHTALEQRVRMTLAP